MKHLPLLRAALGYFAEELAPHDLASQQPYFEDPLQIPWSQEELQTLRNWLQTCELKYAGVEPAGNTLVFPELCSTPDEVRCPSTEVPVRIVVVLLPAAS